MGLFMDIVEGSVTALFGIKAKERPSVFVIEEGRKPEGAGSDIDVFNIAGFTPEERSRVRDAHKGTPFHKSLP